MGFEKIGDIILIGVDSFPKANTLLRWSKSIPSGMNTVKLNDNITVYPTIFSNDFNVNFNSNSNSKNPFAGMVNSGSNSRFSTGRKLEH